MPNLIPTQSVPASDIDPGATVVHQDERFVVHEVSRSMDGLVVWLMFADGRHTRRSKLVVQPDTMLDLEGGRDVQLAALKELHAGTAKAHQTGPESVLFEFAGGWVFELAAVPVPVEDEDEPPADLLVGEEEAPALASVPDEVPDLMDALEGSVDAARAAREADTVASDE